MGKKREEILLTDLRPTMIDWPTKWVDSDAYVYVWNVKHLWQLYS